MGGDVERPPTLVSQELYDAVQARLASNRRERRSTTGGYPLSGLIRCAQCGEPYVGGGGPRNHRDPSDPDRYRFYRDRGGSPGAPICPGRLGTLQKRVVEPAVIAAVAAAVSDPRVQAMIREEIDRYLAGARGDHRVERAELQKEVARLGRERDNLVGAIARGTLTEAEADSQMKRIRQEREAAEAGLRRIARLRTSTKELERERDRLIALASDFAERVKGRGGTALRNLLEPWLETAVFDKETRELTLSIRRVPQAAGVSLPVSLGVHRRVLTMATKRRPHRTGGGRSVTG